MSAGSASTPARPPVGDDDDAGTTPEEEKADEPAVAALCPLTLRELPPSDPLNVAHVFGATTTTSATAAGGSAGWCGHRCYLPALVGYLAGEGGDDAVGCVDGRGVGERGSGVVGGGRLPLCPVCRECPISRVSDGVVVAEEEEEERRGRRRRAGDGDDGEADGEGSGGCSPRWRIVSFRYGKQTYRLAVDTSTDGPGLATLWMTGFLSSSPSAAAARTARTAQGRIRHVLGLSEESFKVLCKGKRIYPDPSLTAIECSSKLLQISSRNDESEKDAKRGGHKSPLVVMGTRIGRELRNDPGRGSGSFVHVLGGGLMALALRVREAGGCVGWGPVGMVRGVFVFAFHLAYGLVAGAFLFVRSFLFLPAAAPGTHEHGD